MLVFVKFSNFFLETGEDVFFFCVFEFCDEVFLGFFLVLFGFLFGYNIVRRKGKVFFFFR